LARWLSCLHCRLTARRSWVRFPHGAMLALGGQILPRVHSAQVGYLLGLSVWSLHVLPVFTRGFLHKEPQQKKHAKRTEHSCPSLTKTDGSLGPRAPKSCPLLLGS